MQVSSVQIRPVTTGANRTEGGSQPFQNVGVGETVSVEVVEAEGGVITLKTGDGTLVKADFPGAPVMRPGDRLELMVTEKTSGQIQMRLTAVNGQSVHVDGTALEVRMMDMGVEPSVVNTRAAQFLIDRNVQPTPERIALLVKTAAQFPELPSSVALFMAANNLPATHQNVNTLMQWVQGGETLGRTAEQLNAAVTQMLAEQGAPSEAARQGQFVVPAGEAQPRAAAQGASPVQSAFADAVMESLPRLPQGMTRESMAAFAEKLSGMTEGEARTAIAGFLSDLTMSVGQKVEFSQALFAAYKGAGKAAAQSPEQAQTPAEENAPVQEGASPRQVAQNEVSIKGEPENQPVQSRQMSAQEQGAQNRTQAGGARDGQGQPVQNQAQAGQDSAAIREMRQVIQLLGKFIVPLESNAETDAESLRESLKNQQSIADSIHSGLAKVVGEASGATQKAADLSSRIQMGNNLENFYYCQVPFQIAQRQQTAELYVFERKRNVGAGEKTNTTILIALETENMGRVETVMRAETDEISIEFRVENDAILGYLQRASDLLAEGLKQSGFSVGEIKSVRMNTPATPLNVDQVLGEKEVFQMQTVDIRV